MIRPALLSQNILIDDLAHQLVLEEVFGRAAERRGLPAKDQFLASQSLQGILNLSWGETAPTFGGRVQMLQRAVPEGAPHDRRPLEHRPFRSRQAVNARLQYSRQRGRDSRGGQARRFNAPFLRPGDNHFLIDQHLNGFFNEKGVAVRSAHQELLERLGYILRLAQNVPNERAALSPRQRLQVQPFMAGQALAPGWPPPQQGRSGPT